MHEFSTLYFLGMFLFVLCFCLVIMTVSTVYMNTFLFVWQSAWCIKYIFVFSHHVIISFSFSFFSLKAKWQGGKEVVLFVHLSGVPSTTTHNRSAVV